MSDPKVAARKAAARKAAASKAAVRPLLRQLKYGSSQERVWALTDLANLAAGKGTYDPRPEPDDPWVRLAIATVLMHANYPHEAVVQPLRDSADVELRRHLEMARSTINHASWRQLVGVLDSEQQAVVDTALAAALDLGMGPIALNAGGDGQSLVP